MSWPTLSNALAWPMNINGNAPPKWQQEILRRGPGERYPHRDIVWYAVQENCSDLKLGRQTLKPTFPRMLSRNLTGKARDQKGVEPIGVYARSNDGQNVRVVQAGTLRNGQKASFALGGNAEQLCELLIECV